MAIKVLALASGVTGLSDHRILESVLVQPAGQLNVRGGVMANVASFALSTVSAMVARISAGKAIIPNTISSALGPYLLVNDANVDITFDAGEAAVPRVDRVIARAYDNTNDASGFTKGDVYYLKGTSGGSATALPSNSILLYEMTIPAGASAGGGGVNFANVVDQRIYTAASGGVFPVANNTQMAAIASPYEGQVCYRTDLDILYIYDGTTWRGKGVANVASSANLTSINNPYDGQTAVTRDTDNLYVYTGSAWKRVTADFNTMATASVYESSNDTTSSATYVPGTSCGLAYVAPSSGSVKITLSCWIGTNATAVSGANRGTFISTATKTGAVVGSGSSFLTPDDSRAMLLGNQTTAAGFKYVAMSYVFLVTGLTPGSSYNTQYHMRSINAADSAAYHHRRMIAEPVY